VIRVNVRQQKRKFRKMKPYFIGVDVGTGSVRAALVTRKGELLCTSSKDTKTWSPKVGYFEQSTDDIWKAVCSVVKVKAKLFLSKTLRPASYG
jgi:ribulose kinase